MRSLVSALVLAVCGCSSQEESFATAPQELDTASASKVEVEIDYAPGAEPITDESGVLGDPWAVAHDNSATIFGPDKEVSIPTKLSDMQRLDDVTQTEITEEDLIAIAEKHRDRVSTRDTVTFYVVYLNATFKDETGTLLPRTTGLSVRGARVVGLFKPAMRFGLNGAATIAFAEQATLVHELGHASGRPHCDNKECVMFWRNELVKQNDADFVHTYLERRRKVLFGSECAHHAH